VRDQVAERDRKESRADRAEPDRSGDAEGHQDHDPEEAEQQDRPLRDARRAEQVEEDLRLRQAVEDDRRDAQRRERDIGGRPARLEETAAEGATADPAVLVDEAEPGQPTEQPEPDREGFALGAPLVAPELGHHREGERGVPDEDDEERGGTRLDDELQPDEEGEANNGRPATE